MILCPATWLAGRQGQQRQVSLSEYPKEVITMSPSLSTFLFPMTPASWSPASVTFSSIPVLNKSIIILKNVSFVENSLVDRLLADLLPHEITDDAPDDWRPRIGQYGSRDRFTSF